MNELSVTQRGRNGRRSRNITMCSLGRYRGKRGKLSQVSRAVTKMSRKVTLCNMGRRRRKRTAEIK